METANTTINCKNLGSSFEMQTNTIKIRNKKKKNDKVINLECKINKRNLIKMVQRVISEVFEKIEFSTIINSEDLIKRCLENG